MSKNTGGSAFPLSAIDARGKRVEGGMTLRDYFAAKSAPMLIRSYDGDPSSEQCNVFSFMAERLSGNGYIENDIAEMAYKIADAMLAERAK